MKCIFIDIDDTLLDFEACTEEALREGFARFGIPGYRPETLPEFLKMNQKLWNRIEDGSLTLDELRRVRFRIFFDSMNVKADGIAFEAFFRSHLRESAIPVRHAREMLDYLRGRYLLATASNGPANQQQHRLALAGFLPYFDDNFISEEVGYSKPSVGFFRTAFSKMQENCPSLTKDDCLIIGDSMTSDMKGGLDFKIHTCFFNRYGIDIQDHRFDYVIDDLLDVRRFL